MKRISFLLILLIVVGAVENDMATAEIMSPSIVDVETTALPSPERMSLTNSRTMKLVSPREASFAGKDAFNSIGAGFSVGVSEYDEITLELRVSTAEQN